MKTNVLVVEDDVGLSEALQDTLSVAGFNVNAESSVETAILNLSNQLPDVLICDVNLRDKNGCEIIHYVREKSKTLPIIMMTAYGTVELAVRAMQAGATDFLQKPFEPTSLIHMIEPYTQDIANGDDIVIHDEKSVALFELARRIAESDSSVLLNGPSGAGKEVMAQYIHQHSLRKEQAFVAINCAAIPENMLEATLFGYEKGAFTGAHQACQGKFEQAQKGTLLLDEVSEMDLGLQAKLLRVLQEREVERLGSRKIIKLDVRLIATTNRQLKDEVIKGRFREDLYYRLNVFPLTCLSLNERPADIVPLSMRLIAKYAKQSSFPIPQLSENAARKLESYEWPGNVRELDNIIQRALILCDRKTVEEKDLLFEIKPSTGMTTELDIDSLENDSSESLLDESSSLGQDVRHHEYQLIVKALQETKGKKKQVAEELGISPRTLRYKLARMRELGYSIPG